MLTALLLLVGLSRMQVLEFLKGFKVPEKFCPAAMTQWLSIDPCTCLDRGLDPVGARRRQPVSVNVSVSSTFLSL